MHGAVSAVVKMTGGGFQVQIVNGKSLGIDYGRSLWRAALSGFEPI